MATVRHVLLRPVGLALAAGMALVGVLAPPAVATEVTAVEPSAEPTPSPEPTPSAEPAHSPEPATDADEEAGADGAGVPYAAAEATEPGVDGTGPSGAAASGAPEAAVAPGDLVVTTSSLVEAGNGRNQATIGEVVTWVLGQDLPEGQAYDSVTFELELPPGMEFVGTPEPTLAGEYLVTGAGYQLDGTHLRIVAEDVLGVGRLELTAQARFPDRPEVAIGGVDGGPLVASLELVPQGGTATTDAVSVGMQLVEPDVTGLTAHNNGAYSAGPGDTIVLSTRAFNAAGAATAHDVESTTVLATAYHPQDPEGEPAVDGGAVGYAGVGVWDLESRTITWPTVTLGPGGEDENFFQVQVVDPLPPGTAFTILGTASGSSLPGDAPGERTAASPGASERYVGSDVLRFAGPVGLLTTAVEGSPATVGDVVTVELSATVPYDGASDVTLVATLPEGLAYVDTVFTGCTVGETFWCPVGEPVALRDGSTFAWFFDEAVPDEFDPSAEVSVRLRVRAVGELAVTPGAVLRITSRLAWNTTDRVAAPTSVADLGTFDAGTTEGGIADVAVRAPGGVLGGRVRVEAPDGDVVAYAAGVALDVTFLGRDRRPGGPDDVTTRVVTDAAGRWQASGLRPGSYRVAVDEATLPPGTVPGRDSDGGAPLVTFVHLDPDQVRPRTNTVLGVAPLLMR